MRLRLGSWVRGHSRWIVAAVAILLISSIWVFSGGSDARPAGPSATRGTRRDAQSPPSRSHVEASPALAAVAVTEEEQPPPKREPSDPSRALQLTRFDDGFVVFRLDGGPSEFTDDTRRDVFGVKPSSQQSRPVRVLSGRVVDASGEPLAGAAVVGSRTPAVLPGPTTGAGELGGRAGALSDDEGRFTMEVSTSRLTVVARSRENGWSEPVSVPKGESAVTQIELVVEGLATITGEVSIEGAAAQGTVSVLRRDDMTVVLARSRIDDEGQYALELPAGSYAVRAQESLGSGWTEGETGRRRTVELDVHVGDRITRDFVFEAGHTVEVRSKQGGAKVGYYLLEDAVESYAELSTLIADPMVTVLVAAPTPDDEEKFAVFQGIEYDEFTVCATVFVFGDAEGSRADCKRLTVTQGQGSSAVLFDAM